MFLFINHLQNESVFETKVKFFQSEKFLFVHRLRSESVFETKVNFFQNENVFILKPFAERKCFRN